MAAPTAQPQDIRGDLAEPPESAPFVVSGVYTASANLEFGLSRRARMVEAVMVQTAGTAGQSITIGIDGWNPADNSWENLITSAAVTSATTATTVVQVNPYAAPITNSSAQRLVRRRMRVTITPADNKNITYSVNLHVGS